MDGSTYVRSESLQAVVKNAMAEMVSFQHLRGKVYGWMKAHGHQLMTTARQDGVIEIHYYDAGTGEVTAEFVNESPQYTKRQPINTW